MEIARPFGEEQGSRQFQIEGWIDFLAGGPFVDDLLLEVATAQVDSPPINSLHAGWAMILEGLAELWEGVREKGAERARQDLLNIAALAIRTALDCGLDD